MKQPKKFARAALSAAPVLMLAACSGGGGGGDTPAAPVASPAPVFVAVSGAVTAPGGALAFNPADSLLIRVARWALSDAVAGTASGSFSGVGAGVQVSLIEIDGSGQQVGATLATAVTAADGSYTLNAPADWTPSSRYLVRANATSGTLDAVVAGTRVDVDPVTHVTKGLVLAAAAASSEGLAAVGVDEVRTLGTEVVALASDTSLRFASAAEAVARLQSIAGANEEVANLVRSTSAAGVIRGTVLDTDGRPMAGVKVVAADFGNWVNRSEAFTDAQGRYTLNVAPGDFILGAINATGVAAASEWWTADGSGAMNKFSAGRVTVGADPVAGDFRLKRGVTLSGKVTGDGAGLGGVQVLLRDATTYMPATGTTTRADGTWQLNVRPGRYTVAAVNQTGQPYASAYLGAGALVTAATAATPIVPTDAPMQVDFALPAGNRLEGRVTDPVGGPVTGTTVRIFDTTPPDLGGSFVNGIRTDLTGTYRLWLPRQVSYLIRARGQAQSVDLSVNDAATTDFGAAVATARGQLVDAGGRPVSQSKIALYQPTSPYPMIGFEVSNGDGSFELYTPQTAAIVEAKVDNGTAIGSKLFGEGVAGTTYGEVVGAPKAFTVGAVRQLGVLALPVGAALTGKVTVGGAPKGGYMVQVRSAASPSAAASGFTATRSQSDGSYTVSLPAGSYAVRACNPYVSCGAFSTVTVGATPVSTDFAL